MRYYMNDCYLGFEYEKTLQIINAYKNLYEDLQSQSMHKIVKKEYNYHSFGLHRGFYCPSIIEDIIIGNAKRGIIKTRKSLTVPSYVFGFDADNNIITSQNEHSIEFIFIENDSEIGLTFDNNKLSLISIVQFENNNLKYYLRSIIENDNIVEISKEEYSFFKKQMKVQWYRKSCCKINSFQQERYVFNIENERLVSYFVGNCNSNVTKKQTNNQIYKVYLPRKI